MCRHHHRAGGGGGHSLARHTVRSPEEKILGETAVASSSKTKACRYLKQISLKIGDY